MASEKLTVSIIIPIHNGSSWIDRCFEGIISQTAVALVNLEVCICNDASTDNTLDLLHEWKERLEMHKIVYKIFNNTCETPGGVGYAKNRAVSISTGTYLCFQDIDDVMLPDRILKQYECALSVSDDTLIGSQFKREPENSTLRYTKWANSLSPEQLNLQVFTSHGPTVIMPTWFCHRKVYDRVGGFFESRKGTPEDLVFFNKHLDLGGKILRVDECLVIYTYHPNAATFSIHEDTIWNIRLERLERVILSNWPKFTIWNAGKQGRKFYNSLSNENKEKVLALCDVDKNKIGQQYIPFDPNERKSGTPVNIIHFKEAISPFVICIKIDLTEGVFENNLKTLNLKEGVDYILFS